MTYPLVSKLLIFQARDSSWVPVDSPVSEKTVNYEAFVFGEKGRAFSNAFLEERECVEKLGRMKNLIVSTLNFLFTSDTEIPHHSSPATIKAS